MSADSMPTEIPIATPAVPRPRQIELRGVRVHNLKNLDLDIPLGKLVVLSGVSGSGKSSLAFDTLYAEGQRRYIESFSISARQHLERIDRPNADCITHVPPAIAIRSDNVRRGRIDGRSTVATVADLLDGFRMLFSRTGRIICPVCNLEVRAHSAADVVGAIAALPAGTRCQLGFAVLDHSDHDPIAYWLARGFSRAIWNGTTHDLNAKPAWPSAGGVSIVVDRLVAGKTSTERQLESAATAMREGGGQCWLLAETDVDHQRDIPIPDKSTHVSTVAADSEILDGRTWQRLRFNRRLVCPGCRREFLPPEPRLFSHLSSGACPTCRGTGRQPDDLSGHSVCLACDGTRFREEARAVQLDHRSIADICRLSPPNAMTFVRNLDQTMSVDELRLTDLIRRDISQRITAVSEIGLGYLTLDRAAGTLSGGETRRLMLAATIGSRITGTLVVVDEPSAGLSEGELPLVINALRRVQSLRNSVIAVEHAPAIVLAADHVIELGPGAGPAGGNIVYQGPPDGWPKPKHEPFESRGLSDGPHLCLKNIQHRNIRNVDIEFPLHQLSVVTGPGGSGKTSLVTDVLFPAICRHLGLPCDVPWMGQCELSGAEDFVDAVLVDQSPLTKSSRSNPATWLDVFDEIRQTFAATADAKQRGYTAQQFSFNSVAGGRCRSCRGTGVLKHDMQFLPDITLVCPECNGTRFRREILEVKYRGRSIADVLAMSISTATTFFRSQPRLQYRFQMLQQIGLDYLVLGQPSETLSGGEAQRLKLAARIAIPANGACLIICDEPTTGLNSADTVKLIRCFRELIANGNTLVLADNSPDLLAAADFVIELPKSH